MKRNWITILLMLCLAALLIGGVLLYRSLTEERSSERADSSLEPVETETTTEPMIESSEVSAEPAPEAVESQTAGPAEDDGLEPAPDFLFTDTEGKELRLSDYFGSPIILNFWATWCGPCQAELPYFNDASIEYADEIKFLMLDLVDGYYETESSCQDFVNEKAYSFPLFFDAKGEGAMSYGVSAIPRTIAINAEGKIVADHLGSMNRSDLQELIDLLLK